MSAYIPTNKNKDSKQSRLQTSVVRDSENAYGSCVIAKVAVKITPRVPYSVDEME